MKIRPLPLAAALLLALLPLPTKAQNGWSSAFNKFKLEARADAEAQFDNESTYGMHGRYFNLMVGGDLTNGFSYYFRQRLKAEAGSVHFFDNTDFLWLNYQWNPNWRVRLGKDAMAVGGYEYDAAPIDEYLVSEYWNNFYCFQLGVSVAYTTDDGRQTMVVQATQSPYLQSLGLAWNYGLLSYNIEWLGSIGDHLHTLWSTSMIERERGIFMNLTMLGTQLVFDRWDCYLDLMHHALSADDWGKNWGFVFRTNVRIAPAWTLFAKASHEENNSDIDINSTQWVDQLVPAGHSYTKVGLGAEWRPKSMESVRLHGYVGLLSDLESGNSTPNNSLTANLGFTWTMDFLPLFKK